MHCVSDLCYILNFSIVNFPIFIHFTNQITLKQSLTRKLNLISKFSSIKRQMNIPLWTHMWRKGWRKDGKTFARCYTIALEFWDEFNANFVLQYFSSFRSIKIWHFYLKNVEKKQGSVFNVAHHLSSHLSSSSLIFNVLIL